MRSTVKSALGLTSALAAIAVALPAAAQTAAVVPATEGAGAMSANDVPEGTPAAGATGAPDQASADGAGLADIVVTAQKRSESLQKTPAAVTAVSGVALTQRGIANL